jgi:hypothetical protein
MSITGGVSLPVTEPRPLPVVTIVTRQARTGRFRQAAAYSPTAGSRSATTAYYGHQYGMDEIICASPTGQLLTPTRTDHILCGR